MRDMREIYFVFEFEPTAPDNGGHIARALTRGRDLEDAIEATGCRVTGGGGGAGMVGVDVAATADPETVISRVIATAATFGLKLKDYSFSDDTD